MSDPRPPDDMLVGLQGLRLPEGAPGGLLAEVLVAVGLGLVIAWGLSFLVGLVSTRVVQVTPSLRDQLAALRDLPEAERSVALLHLIRTHDRAVADQLGARLYGRGDFPTSDELEGYLMQLAARHA